MNTLYAEVQYYDGKKTPGRVKYNNDNSPVCITFLIGLICLLSLYFTMHKSNGLGFGDNNQFYNTVQVLSDSMYEVFEHGRENRRERLNIMSTLIDKNSTYMLVYENGEVFFESGNVILKNESLMEAASDIKTKAFVSDNNCQLFYYDTTVKGAHYELYLFNTPSHSDNEAVKTVYYLEPTIKNRKQQKKKSTPG